MTRQEEVDETQVLAALLGIAEMVGSLSDTEEILESIVRIAPSLVGVDRCALMTYDEPARAFRTTASFEPSEGPAGLAGLTLLETDMPTLAQRLVKKRLPVLLKDAAKDPILPPAVTERLALRSLLIAPLVCRGRLLGCMWLDSTKAPHYFTSKEINLILGIATEAAVALDNGQALDAARREGRRLEALTKVLCDGVITVGPNLRVIRLDPSAERLLGWTTQEIQGRSMAEVFDISEGEASIAWRKEGSVPSPAPKDLRLMAHDGVRVHCQILTGVVRDEDKAIVEILYAIRKKPGSKGAEDRAVEALRQLASAEGDRAPPE